MKEIKKIYPFSLAKIFSGVYASLGFVCSIFFAIIVMSNIIYQESFDGSVLAVLFFHIGGGVLVGLVVALIFGIIGLIFGYILGALYNFFASHLGGIKIDLGEK